MMTSNRIAILICKKNFRNTTNFNTHLLKHTGVKPHKCSCDKSYFELSKIKRHEVTHTGAKPYECPESNKAFAEQSNLDKNLRLLTGVSKSVQMLF